MSDILGGGISGGISGGIGGAIGGSASGLGGAVGGAIGGAVGGAIGGARNAALARLPGPARMLASRFGSLGAAAGLSSVWIRRNRSIGSIIPDVIIEENHVDRVQVTQHPVAQGSPISDHAFKQPMMLTIRCGWTDAGHQPGRIKQVYATLIALMGTEKKPIEAIDISTGKRSYKNMVLTELTTRTSTETENAMIIEAQFTEVIRVRTKATQAPKTSLLEDAAKTQAQNDTTPKQGEEKPEDKSIALRISGQEGTQGPPPKPATPTPPTTPPATPKYLL